MSISEVFSPYLRLPAAVLEAKNIFLKIVFYSPVTFIFLAHISVQMFLSTVKTRHTQLAMLRSEGVFY